MQGIPHLRLDGLDTDFGLVVLRLGHSVELLLEILFDADDEMYLVRDYLHLGGACDLDVTEFLRIRRVLGHERGRGHDDCRSGSRKKRKSFHILDY